MIPGCITRNLSTVWIGNNRHYGNEKHPANIPMYVTFTLLNMVH